MIIQNKTDQKKIKAIESFLFTYIIEQIKEAKKPTYEKLLEQNESLTKQLKTVFQEKSDIEEMLEYLQSINKVNISANDFKEFSLALAAANSTDYKKIATLLEPTEGMVSLFENRLAYTDTEQPSINLTNLLMIATAWHKNKTVEDITQSIINSNNRNQFMIGANTAIYTNNTDALRVFNEHAKFTTQQIDHLKNIAMEQDVTPETKDWNDRTAIETLKEIHLQNVGEKAKIEIHEMEQHFINSLENRKIASSTLQVKVTGAHRQQAAAILGMKNVL